MNLVRNRKVINIFILSLELLLKLNFKKVNSISDNPARDDVYELVINKFSYLIYIKKEILDTENHYCHLVLQDAKMMVNDRVFFEDDDALKYLKNEFKYLLRKKKINNLIKNNNDIKST